MLDSQNSFQPTMTSLKANSELQLIQLQNFSFIFCSQTAKVSAWSFKEDANRVQEEYHSRLKWKGSWMVIVIIPTKFYAKGGNILSCSSTVCPEPPLLMQFDFIV